MVLITGPLLLGAALIVLGFAPIAQCPECLPAGSPLPTARLGAFSSSVLVPAGLGGAFPPCLRCKDRGKVSYLNRWFVRNWEGKPVSVIVSRGFRKSASASVWDRTGIRLGGVLTRDLLESAQVTALQTGAYQSVKLDAFDYPYTPGSVRVVMTVVEK
jgi:hypothetical protein